MHPVFHFTYAALHVAISVQDEIHSALTYFVAAILINRFSSWPNPIVDVQDLLHQLF